MFWRGLFAGFVWTTILFTGIHLWDAEREKARVREMQMDYWHIGYAYGRRDEQMGHEENKNPRRMQLHLYPPPR